MPSHICRGVSPRVCLVFRLRLANVLSNKKKIGPKQNSLDQSDKIYMLKNFQDQLLDNLVLRGVKNIKRVRFETC